MAEVTDFEHYTGATYQLMVDGLWFDGDEVTDAYTIVDAETGPYDSEDEAMSILLERVRTLSPSDLRNDKGVLATTVEANIYEDWYRDGDLLEQQGGCTTYELPVFLRDGQVVIEWGERDIVLGK